MPLFRRRVPPDPRINQLTQELAALTARLAELEGRARTTEARVDEVGSALTNQLHEISGELDSSYRTMDQRLAALDSLTVGRLAAADKAQHERLAAFRDELDLLSADIEAGREATANGRANGHVDPVALDELRQRQAQIANEVARHEIAFHQELAALADRLMRQRPGR
jgi:DNA repair exonuclease SbcCD ATPase subunit